MADQVQDSLLREIDEELRQEKFAKLWKRYGNYVLGAAVALVLAVAGYKGWQAWDIKNRTAESDRFVAALAAVGQEKFEDASRDFAALAEDSSGGYAVLARLREAAALTELGEKAEAVKIYEMVAADSATPDMFKGLAIILSVLHTVDGDDVATQRGRLEPLTADDNPWRFNAKELLGVIAQKQGEIDKARDIFKSLTQDTAAPAGVRSRAGELLAALG